jgi:hypothetical protein
MPYEKCTSANIKPGEEGDEDGRELGQIKCHLD